MTTNGPNHQPPRQQPPRPPDPQQLLKAELEKIKKSLAEVLPKHVTAERMVKVVLSATARQPKLLECTTASIARSVMQAAELGLEIGGLLGEAYLVPYNVKIRAYGQGADRWEKQAQCIAGYRGLIKLARQSGEIESVMARVAYKTEHFVVHLGTDERIEHVLDPAANHDEKEIVAVYCLVKYKDSERPQFDVMSKDDVDKVRKRSRASDDGPWVTDYAEMARKTVTRRLLKYAPISAERLHRALELEDERESAIDTVGDVVTSTTVQSLEDKLLGSKTPSAREQLGADPPKAEPEPVAVTPTPGPAASSATPTPTPTTTTKQPDGAPPAAAKGRPERPGRRPDFCVVCDKIIDFERDGAATETADGIKGYRHEACNPDPFNLTPQAVDKDLADAEPPPDVKTLEFE